MENQLKKLIEIIGINQKDFADSIGVSPSTITEVIRGRSRSFNSDTLLKISNIYNVNLHWLLTGEGDMFVTPCPLEKGVEEL